jgi:excisionase family DNA binding protein
MTVPELAECLNVSTITIYRLLKAGQLPAFRVGSDWRFSADAIAQWMKELSRVCVPRSSGNAKAEGNEFTK